MHKKQDVHVCRSAGIAANHSGWPVRSRLTERRSHTVLTKPVALCGAWLCGSSSSSSVVIIRHRHRQLGFCCKGTKCPGNPGISRGKREPKMGHHSDRGHLFCSPLSLGPSCCRRRRPEWKLITARPRTSAPSREREPGCHEILKTPRGVWAACSHVGRSASRAFYPVTCPEPAESRAAGGRAMRLSDLSPVGAPHSARVLISPSFPWAAERGRKVGNLPGSGGGHAGLRVSDCPRKVYGQGIAIAVFRGRVSRTSCLEVGGVHEEWPKRVFGRSSGRFRALRCLFFNP